MDKAGLHRLFHKSYAELFMNQRLRLWFNDNLPRILDRGINLVRETYAHELVKHKVDHVAGMH